MPTLLLALSFCLIPLATLFAQGNAVPSPERKLAYVIQGAVGDLTLSLPSGFQSVVGSVAASRLNLASFNSGIAAELSNLPASSSASALRYTFDTSVGAYVPSPQSLGPVLAERAETIGKDKLFLAVTYQRFQFDHQDNVDLRNFRIAFPVTLPAGTLGPLPVQTVAEASFSVSLVVNEVTAHVTYGITRWLDVSYGFTVLRNSLDFQVNAGFEIPQQPPIQIGASRTAHASSTGLGDGLARVKAKIFDRGGLALAVATDVRLPIGDEFNFQGAGAYGLKPFFIASYTARAISPHLNLGYQWNGKSYLASPTGMEKQRLPSQVSCALGADVSVSRRLTTSFDVLDQIVLHAPGLNVNTQTVGTDTYRYVEYLNRTRHEVNGAGGLKISLTNNVVFTGNLLFRLNQAGVRTRVAPFAGLSYVF